jgi:hypothetical protein
VISENLQNDHLNLEVLFYTNNKSDLSSIYYYIQAKYNVQPWSKTHLQHNFSYMALLRGDLDKTYSPFTDIIKVPKHY